MLATLLVAVVVVDVVIFVSVSPGVVKVMKVDTLRDPWRASDGGWSREVS